MKSRMIAAAALAASVGVAMAGIAQAGQVGLWQFDGDLSNEVAGGNPMSERNDSSVVPIVESYDSVVIDGGNATVANLSRLGYNLPNGRNGEHWLLMPNDKNAPTRTWTLVMDVNFDQGYQGGGYSSLFQTNTGNSGDGDIFVLESSGGIGISSTYGGTSSPQTWHRFAITAQDGVGINKYIDGVNVGSQGWQDRFEIADSDLLLFVDNATETSEVLVNSVAFYDEALSDAQLATLGAPVAGGIPAGVPVPEPTGLVLLGSAMLLGLGCRRRRA